MGIQKSVGVLLLLPLLWSSGTTAAATANKNGCPERIIHFKITKKDIIEMDRSEAQGHMPWRNDPSAVAYVWACKADLRLNPGKTPPIPFRHRVVSSFREVYVFRPAHGETIRVTVRRFRYRDPDTAKPALSVWWATRAVVIECPKGSAASE